MKNLEKLKKKHFDIKIVIICFSHYYCKIISNISQSNEERLIKFSLISFSSKIPVLPTLLKSLRGTCTTPMQYFSFFMLNIIYKYFN